MSDRRSTITCCCGFQVSVKTDALSCPRCGADLRPLRLLRAIPPRRHDGARGLNAAGRPFEAGERLGAALAFKPDFADALGLLANLYLDAGDRTRAEYEARAGRVQDPGRE